MLIDTLAGKIEESKLVKTESAEKVPCGECITTEYFLDDELVRRDIEIRVPEGFVNFSAAGL